MAKTTKAFWDFIGGKKNWHIILMLQAVLHRFNADFQVKPAWLGLGWKAGKNFICMAAPHKDHVELMIMYGILLHDSKNVFEGTWVNTRHIKYFSVNDIDEPYLCSLLNQQAKLYASGMKWEG